MEPHFYRVDPGAGSEGAYDHIGEEFVFVLSGTLEVWLEEREHHVLGPGTASTFRARFRTAGTIRGRSRRNSYG